MASVDAFTILQKHFQINRKQFYYLRGKLTKNTSFGEYLDELRGKGCIVAYENWPEAYPMPQVLLIMTKAMQDNYKVFADSVMFDITYKLCSVSIDDKGKLTFWNVGIFATTI
jgi:hypothetical protein